VTLPAWVVGVCATLAVVALAGAIQLSVRAWRSSFRGYSNEPQPAPPSDFKVLWPSEALFIGYGDRSRIPTLAPDTLHWREGAISLWVYLPPAGKGFRDGMDSRYLIGHFNPVTTGKKHNLFALRLTPRSYKALGKNPEWRLSLNSPSAEGYQRPDSDGTWPMGWTHFVVCWHHERLRFELIINGEVAITAPHDFADYWPRELGREITVGGAPNKSDCHYCRTNFWRIQRLDVFPDEEWVRAELARAKDAPDVKPPGWS
jgi:hypothetical protein